MEVGSLEGLSRGRQGMGFRGMGFAAELLGFPKIGSCFYGTLIFHHKV